MNSMNLVRLRCNGYLARTVAALWFGGNLSEYKTIIDQLSSIGWQLPRNNDGAHAWFNAGSTDCCGRTMISLTALDVVDEEVPLAYLLAVSAEINERAATICCLMTDC